MPRPPRLIFVVLAACLPLGGLAAACSEFFVASNGSDTAPGTKEHPFATLEKARDAVRNQTKVSGLPPGGVTVWVRGGTFPLARTFTLGKEDSGKPGSPVIYRSFPGEKATLTGGRSITGFVPHQGAILKADLGSQGLSGIHFRQLFLDGKRQPLARYPNADPDHPVTGGWAYVDGETVPMYKDIPGEDKRTVTLKPVDRRRWSHPEDGEVFIYARYNWWNDIVRIQSVDEVKHTLTLADDCSYAVRPNDRFYVQNLLEELDSPGEWYLEKRSSTLFYWPPAPLQGKRLEAPALDSLIRIEPGTRSVTLRGFGLEFCGGTAVTMKGSVGCLIAGCTLRGIGDKNGNGILIDGGTTNGAVGNDISDIGRNGIVLRGGDRLTLTPAGNFADNNHIHHTGVYFKQGIGVEIGGCGNRASHNLIHDAPRFGICFMGNNHVIEYNHLHHLCLETEDTGAVYTGGRDWISSRGSVLRYNFIHDIYGFGQEKGKWVAPFFAWGIYLDDNTGGVDVIGNIVARCSLSCIHLHDGRDNLIANNVFVEGGKEQVTYGGWTTEHKYWKRFHDGMVQGYESIRNQPAWKGIRNIGISPDQSVLTNGLVMTGNEFHHNIIDYSNPAADLYRMNNVPFDHNSFDHDLLYHQGLPFTNKVSYSIPGAPKGQNSWEAWQKLGNDRHSLIADPLFVDPSRDDYRLRPESPAFKLGFQQIPVEKIGPYADELRASWPIVEKAE